ncbi:MAG: ribonuclease HII [Candidatus Omnitrophica bacterium]|nr:ribonuclease HII [Candidatus Omnitrophota bacterium]MCF7877593.1 ribonuclease HII [Candidatus Omnitrophota bacterium]MCF7877919.1 ribonuclease HII [Candidatus Omnitrophota bacterium]MCF7893178.1 ribonuclease HII [Candidatus Omnitrophota bacterium]
MIVGIDEAGRGPLAGSVVVCALALRNRFPYPVKDSKALSVKKREFVFSWILKNCDYAVSKAGKEEIEELNILGATYLAAERAIIKLINKDSKFKSADFIIDGSSFKTKLDIKHRSIKKADEKIAQVACASVVAKVTRDYLMQVAGFLYPQWNFPKHKGYPTREHYSLIDKYKLSPLHRRSFLKNINFL